VIRILTLFLIIISLFAGCTTGPDIAGTESGSQTTNGFMAAIKFPDGTPAAGITVQVRPRNYLSDTVNVLNKSLVSKRDLITDNLGRFAIASLDTGGYTIEARDKNGNAVAIPCSLSIDTVINLGTRTLSPMATIAVFTGGLHVNGFVRVRGLERCFRTVSGELIRVNVPAGQTYTLNVITADTSVDLTPISDVNASETTSVSIDLGDNRSDSLAIRAFLDSMGLDTVSVGSVAVADSESGRLRSLNLSHRGLNEIPLSIGNLSFLWSLDVSKNSISSLPSTLKDIPQLTALSLDSTDISIFPAVVTECTSLQWLLMRATGIRDLPQELTRLSALHVLDMSEDSLTIVPMVISSLLSLKTLMLSRNQLKKIPEEISNLKSLEYLHLDDNQLDSLPDTITSLKNLTTLYVYRNNLSTLPDSIGNMAELTTLDVQSNKLTSLPASIVNCTHLVYIHLWGNLLTALPDKMIDLKPSNGLFLGSNHLCNLPDSLSVWADRYGETNWRSKQVCP
jgi:Leucine-rich repeat (LRR) protein